ncbi:hypothetical protein ACQ4PT_069700 [Festuca glaucescens]
MGCDRETRSEPLDAIGGRLWLTAEDDSDADEIATKSGCSPPVLSYLCRAPSPSPSRSLTSPSSSSAETSSSSLRGDRVAKRIQKRTDQRRAMMELMAMPSPLVSPNRVFNGLGKQVSPARKELPKALLEPSVFVLEEFKADEWIKNTTQGGTMANEVSVVASETGKGSKKKDKLADIVCFKCDDSGHFAADCQAVLCLLCDSAKHATVDCHYHNMPKPTAVMYGLCRDDLLFFDIPKTDGVKSKRDSGKNGIIRVKGGSMSVHQIIKELSFVVPGNHQWDISQTEENVFSVVYPSKADKARLRKINDIKVDDSGCTMFFEEGTNQNLDSWKTREAWVRFSGCPKELRDDYLALFAVGSLIGKTKQVDMEFTQAGEVVRLLAQVLNPDLIPDEVEHYFDGEGFRLSIEVEGPAAAAPARPWKCCDAAPCTKSIPPICHCRDEVEQCDAACKDCVPSTSHPSLYVCNDQYIGDPGPICRPWNCCDLAPCTRSIPPICRCLDEVDQCAATCKDCAASTSDPSRRGCQDVFRGWPGPRCTLEGNGVGN